MKVDPTRIFGWGVPILCMTIAFYTIFTQNSAFNTASNARDQANRDLEAAAQDKNATMNLPRLPKYAADPDIPEEEPKFMAYLRTRALANNVNLDNWSIQALEYGKDRSSSNPDPKINALLKGIKKISTTLTLSGPYTGLRALIGELESSNRLITLSNVTWKRTNGGNVLVLTVGRYIQPQTPATEVAAKPQ